MPAWSLEDGGPLSDYQIDQLVQLIQYGDWQAAQDRVVNLGLAPLVPFISEPDPGIIEGLKSLPDGEQLASGDRPLRGKLCGLSRTRWRWARRWRRR